MKDRPIADLLLLLTKSLPAERAFDWRSDPVKREALRRFPGTKVRALATIIERRPGFRDEEARRRFGVYIRSWAREWLAGGWWQPRAPYRRGARDRLVAVAQAANGLARVLNELDPRELQEVSRHVAWLVRDYERAHEPASRASLPLETREALRALTTFDQNEKRAARVRMSLRSLPPATAIAAQRAGELATVPTRFPDRQGLAFRDLALLWEQVTGRKPTLTYRSLYSSRAGSFPEFARMAMHAMWPDAGNLDGLIRKACTQSARKKP